MKKKAPIKEKPKKGKVTTATVGGRPDDRNPPPKTP
jgi:hypothetical protein